MKTKLIALTCVMTILLNVTPCAAYQDDQSLNMAVDVLVARPICLAATLVGSVLFVISLPVAATSRSVKQAARTFVVKPAQVTFTRPLGDMDALREDW